MLCHLHITLSVQDWVRMLERLLKLSLPTLYFWLAMFYVLFHLWLNIVAEATRFGDREFYKVRLDGSSRERSLNIVTG